MYYFMKNNKNSIMVMTLCGENLEQLFKRCNNKFSLKTVLMFANQALERL